jgi:hypothetical protein
MAFLRAGETQGISEKDAMLRIATLGNAPMTSNEDRITHVKIMTDGNAFFWFKVPEGTPPNDYRLDASTIRKTEPGFALEVAGLTIELHGPFESEAECQKDSDRVMGDDESMARVIVH